MDRMAYRTLLVGPGDGAGARREPREWQALAAGVLPALRTLLRRCAAAALGSALLLAGLPFLAPAALANPAGTDLIISEVYGGAGADLGPYRSDYVELYNPTDAPIALDGAYWLSYRPAEFDSDDPPALALTGTVPAQRHFLIRFADDEGTGAELPTPDQEGTFLDLGMSGGRIFLQSAAVIDPLPDGNTVGVAHMVDVVSQGGAISWEGTQGDVVPSDSQSLQRKPDATRVYQDTDDTLADLMSGTPNPENSSTGPGLGEPDASTVPAAPTGVTAVAGDSQLFVSWSAPDDGGLPITSYALTMYQGTTAVKTLQVAGNSAGRTVSGLTNTTPYTFTVTATNPAGTSPESAPSEAVAPAAGGPVEGVSATPSLSGFNEAVAFSPDGTLVYLADSPENQVVVVRAATGTAIASVPVGGYPSGIAMSPDGRRAYVTNYSQGTVSVIDTEANLQTGMIGGVGANPLGIAVSPDGMRAYVANNGSNSVSVIDLMTQATIATIPLSGTPAGIAVSSDGSRVYVTNSAGSNVVSMIDTASLTVLATLVWDDLELSRPHGLALSPDGARLYVAHLGALQNEGPGAGAAVSAIDLPSFAMAGVISMDGGVIAVAVSPDSQTIYAVNLETRTVTILDPSLQIRSTIVLPLSAPYAAAVSPDGNRVYVTDFHSDQVAVLTGGPVTPPGAPTGLAATPGDAEVALSWTAPASDGRRPITDYKAEYSKDGGTTWETFAHGVSTLTTATVTGLTNGTEYSFRVSAINIVGTGPASTPATAIPVAVPTAPTGVTATAGDSRAFVSWTAPVDDGGTAITSYTVTAYAGTTAVTSRSVAGHQLGQTILGLTNGTAYTFTVVATNAVGDSPHSTASGAVTLAAGGVPGEVSATITVGADPTGVTMSPDGTRAYVVNNGAGSVSVIDTATNAVTGTTTVGTKPSMIALSPDGRQGYVTNSGSGSVSVIDTATNAVTGTIAVGTSPQGIVVSFDGTRAYVTNNGSNTVSVIDIATGTVTGTIAVGAQPDGIAITPDGTKVYVADLWSNSVSVIDTATGTEAATITAGLEPTGIAISPDGTKVYVTNAGNGSVSVIDTATNAAAGTVAVGTSPAGVAVSPGGARVYVANTGSNSVSIIDAATNAVTGTVTVGANPAGVAVSPDGAKVYVANQGAASVSVLTAAELTEPAPTAPATTPTPTVAPTKPAPPRPPTPTLANTGVAGTGVTATVGVLLLAAGGALIVMARRRRGLRQ